MTALNLRYRAQRAAKDVADAGDEAPFPRLGKISCIFSNHWKIQLRTRKTMENWIRTSSKSKCLLALQHATRMPLH